MRKTLLLLPLPMLLANAAFAQGDLAYMPASAPARTADDAGITMHETDAPSTVRFEVPVGTYRIDLINGQGAVIDQLSDMEVNAFDLTRMRAGTWTLRAHTPNGMRVRRFVVHQREGLNWVVEVAPRTKRR